MDMLKWFLPGIGIKRWVLLLTGGIVFMGVGAVNLVSALWPQVIVNRLTSEGILLISIGMMILGMILIGFAIRSIVLVVLHACIPDYDDKNNGKIIDILLRSNLLKYSPKIVAIGGGTGLSRLLLGLREISNNITAIVTVADDGGSSGRLRALDLPAPGDIRNCILALASASDEMQEVFNYRYMDDSRTPEGLAGHSFGNIFLATLFWITGDFSKAVKSACQILDVRGNVLPVTNSNEVHLAAELVDGRIIVGETQVGATPAPIKKLWLQPECTVTADVLAAIAEADLIVLGPGSLYTSTIATLLPRGMADAIQKSSADVIYISNLMTQANESLNYSASDHVQAIEDHIGPNVIDAMLVNKTEISANQLERYAREGAKVVQVDRADLDQRDFHVIYADLLDSFEQLSVRHDPAKVAWELARYLYQKNE